MVLERIGLIGKGRSLLALLALVGASMAPAFADESDRSVALLDDQGDALTEVVEVCFRRDLERSCLEVLGGDPVSWPEGYPTLEVEGERYGPVRASRADLGESERFGVSLQVPRKATLRIDGLPSEARPTLSFYSLDDWLMRFPAFRFESVSGAGQAVPAGEFILSISARGLAPDLHRVSLAPGETETLAFAARTGWSAVLRVDTGEERRPVEGAEVRILPLSDRSADTAARVVALGSTDRTGVALINGITFGLVNAEIEHPGLVPTVLRAISATAGTFAVRDTTLRAGGSLSVALTLDGEPMTDASCEILDFASSSVGRQLGQKAIARLERSRQGVFVGRKLPPGTHTLRVEPSDGAAHVDRTVEIVSGEETSVSLGLEVVALTGTVFRGSDSAGAGYQVEVISLDEPAANGALPDSSTVSITDEDGEYRARLWTGGRYLLLLLSPAEVPVTSLRTVLFAGEEEQDFFLEEGAIEGQVVDEDGRGVDGASVRMTWNSSVHTAIGAGNGGYFSFPLEGDGHASLTAAKQGYAVAERIELDVVSGSEPPPVRLVLHREAVLHGMTRAASGAGVAGVRIASFAVGAPGEMRFLGETVSAPDGSFTLPRAPAGTTRLFGASLACPLDSLDVPAGVSGSGSIDFDCLPNGAVLDLVFSGDGKRHPAGHAVLVRTGNVVMPPSLLQGHLAALGLPVESDQDGRLVIPVLAPGTYDLFLAESSSVATVAAGHPDGFLARVQLTPSSTTEVLVSLDDQ